MALASQESPGKGQTPTLGTVDCIVILWSQRQACAYCRVFCWLETSDRSCPCSREWVSNKSVIPRRQEVVSHLKNLLTPKASPCHLSSLSVLTSFVSHVFILSVSWQLCFIFKTWYPSVRGIPSNSAAENPVFWPGESHGQRRLTG